jgi:hypothetical protein
MMKKKKFKLELGDRVYIIGQAGLCIITGRGNMDFLSGGNLNIYQVDGAHGGYWSEDTLLTKEEMQIEIEFRTVK